MNHKLPQSPYWDTNAQSCHRTSFKGNKEGSRPDNLTPEINKNITSMTEQMKECHKQIENLDKNKHTEDQCARCGNTPCMHGFRCPASRNQCKYCREIGHFSHMCFKKPQEQTYKKEPHTPQAHQIHVRRYSSINQQCDQEDTSRNEDSFCLQIQIKPVQADQESCETQQLFTHLEYKLKYHRRSTKFLRARIDTWSNTTQDLNYKHFISASICLDHLISVPGS